MKLLGILSLLLITSSSVLCRRISSDLNNGTPEGLTNVQSIMMEKVVEKEKKISELENMGATTPSDTGIVGENIAVPEETETESFDNEGKFKIPISRERIQMMLKKAIIQIIMGDLSTADMELLKSLNYDAEQVRIIREEELRKRNDQQESTNEKRKPRNGGDHVENEKTKVDNDWKDIPRESRITQKKDYDYELYNKQATLDYENAATSSEFNGSSTDFISEYDYYSKSSTEESVEKDERFQRPHVIFKISYNDSEFDSRSEENQRRVSGEETDQSTTFNGTGNKFPAAVTSVNSSPAPVDDQIHTVSELFNITKEYFLTTDNPIEDNDVNSRTIPSVDKNEDDKLTINSTELPEILLSYKNVENSSDVEENHLGVLFNVATLSSSTETPNATSNSTSNDNRTILSTKYKGLRWVQDNVYQVLPEYIDAIPSDMMDNDTSDSSYEDSLYQNVDDVAAVNNPTMNEDHLVQVDGMADDAPDSIQLLGSNISAGENAANLTRREAQKRKTEEDIKMRVLAFTNRLNSTMNSNSLLQPPRERLSMYSPICGIPRNTDIESWQDPLSMNMNFQLNLTSEQHLVAAKLRLYKLPQDNLTATTSTNIDGVENEEKKIRISVYYYLKSLKKNRTKKRLMDSKVTSLSGIGEHLALDVKTAVRHWRLTTHNKNHGLVVLVEDQEGHPLQPGQFIQTSNCQGVANLETQDDKAYQRVPAIFIRACTRYVRFVDNREIIEHYCGSQSDRLSSSQDDVRHY